MKEALLKHSDFINVHEQNLLRTRVMDRQDNVMFLKLFNPYKCTIYFFTMVSLLAIVQMGF